MKIAIATTGRFHVLDLAKELIKNDYEVMFYSLVPPWRLKYFGIEEKYCKNLFFWMLPMIVLQRMAKGRWLRIKTDNLLNLAIDWLIAFKLEQCEIFIGMSGLSNRSAIKAKANYGAKIYIERGSRHILSQKRILDDLKKRGLNVETVDKIHVKRELISYDLADKIVVASTHVQRSFVEEGCQSNKLFVNNYGVDLNMFPPTKIHSENIPPTILYVGAWSYRKGVDILVKAWEPLEGVELIHVGSIVDAPLPKSKRFKHFEPIPQWGLKEIYKLAHIFVIASREEGLALVQLQALACGLPLVCTDRTGGEDLKRIIENNHLIKVVKHDDAVSLGVAIKELLPYAMKLNDIRNIYGQSRLLFSWEEYGKKYINEIIRDTERKTNQYSI